MAPDSTSVGESGAKLPTVHFGSPLRPMSRVFPKEIAMRTLMCLASLGMLAILGPATVSAQPPRGGGFGMMGGPAMLVGQESVKKELKVSEEQGKKLEEFATQMREKRQGLRDLDPEERRAKMAELNKESEKALGEILTAEQNKRLKQISYQISGARAFNNPDVVSALKITDEQKSDLQKINQEAMTQIQELMQGAGGPPDEDTMKKMRALQTEATEKAVKVLTDDQRKQWKEMTGEPFKGEIKFGQRPGGQR
jgi:hypothetical protein